MNANKVSTLTLKMIDGVTGPAGRIKAAIKSIGSTAKGIPKDFNVANAHMQRALERQREIVGNMKRNLAGLSAAVGVGAGFKASINSFKELETKLVDIAQKTGMSKDAITELRIHLQNEAKKVNQSAQQMASAFDLMIGAGLPKDVVDKLVGPTGKTAHAYGANPDDIAKMIVSFFRNMGIKPDDIPRALDVQSHGGKMGGFETQDMSRHMPYLAAAYSRKGLPGILGVADINAAAQVVNTETGDPDKSATRLDDLIQKSTSPDVRKNFEEYGINIAKEINAGLAKGISPFETIVSAMNRAKAKGADATDLFGDKEARAAAEAISNNLAEYLRIRNESMTNSSGTVDADWKLREDTLEAKLRRFMNQTADLANVVGEKLAPAMKQVLDHATGLAASFTEWGKSLPTIRTDIAIVGAGLVTIAGALSTLRIALAGLGLIGLGGATGSGGKVLKLGGGFAVLNEAGNAAQENQDDINKWWSSLRPTGARDMPIKRDPNKWRLLPYDDPLQRNVEMGLQVLGENLGLIDHGFQETNSAKKGDVPAGISIPAIEETTQKVEDLKSYFGDLNTTVAKPQIVIDGLDALLQKIMQVKAGLQSLSTTPIRPIMKPVYADVGTGEGSGW